MCMDILADLFAVETSAVRHSPVVVSFLEGVSHLTASG